MEYIPRDSKVVLVNKFGRIAVMNIILSKLESHTYEGYMFDHVKSNPMKPNLAAISGDNGVIIISLHTFEILVEIDNEEFSTNNQFMPKSEKLQKSLSSLVFISSI